MPSYADEAIASFPYFYGYSGAICRILPELTGIL
jgi:hypothetical protein